MNFISKLIRTAVSFCIIIIRPFLGPSNCYYPIGCTQFALLQLKDKNKPIHIALWIITCRVLSCNPFTRFFGLYYARE